MLRIEPYGFVQVRRSHAGGRLWCRKRSPGLSRTLARYRPSFIASRVVGDGAVTVASVQKSVTALVECHTAVPPGFLSANGPNAVQALICASSETPLNSWGVGSCPVRRLLRTRMHRQTNHDESPHRGYAVERFFLLVINGRFFARCSRREARTILLSARDGLRAVFPG